MGMIRNREPFLIIGCLAAGLLALIVCGGVAVVVMLTQF